jgi:hypothetical protein
MTEIYPVSRIRGGHLFVMIMVIVDDGGEIIQISSDNCEITAALFVLLQAEQVRAVAANCLLCCNALWIYYPGLFPI